VVLKANDFKSVEKVQNVLQNCSLKILDHHQTKLEEAIIGTWKTIGSPENHEKFVLLMIKDKDIKELNY